MEFGHRPNVHIFIVKFLHDILMGVCIAFYDIAEIFHLAGKNIACRQNSQQVGEEEDLDHESVAKKSCLNVYS